MREFLGNKIDKLKTERDAMGREAREKVMGYILTAFGLVAGLAWNEAVKALIETIYPSEAGGGVIAKFIYAGVVTVFVVIVSIALTHIGKKNE